MGGLSMTTLDKIRRIMEERGWTEYRLAKETGLSQSTLSNMFNRNTMPTLPTLENICTAFGVTMSQFFTDGNTVELSDEQMVLFNKWSCLTDEQKKLVMDIINNFS